MDYLVLSSFLTGLQEEVAIPMTPSWQRLSPTERWLLICQIVLIGADALAWAMANEASRQFNSWLIRLDCPVIPVGRVIPHMDWLYLDFNR